MIGIRVEVDKITKSIGRQVVSRGYRAVNAIRNAELEVLNGKGGGTYVASAPGQPPARRSGALRQAWSGRVEEGASGGGSTSIVAVLQSDMFYAEYLENGTRKWLLGRSLTGSHRNHFLRSLRYTASRLYKEDMEWH